MLHPPPPVPHRSINSPLESKQTQHAGHTYSRGHNTGVNVPRRNNLQAYIVNEMINKTSIIHFLCLIPVQCCWTGWMQHWRRDAMRGRRQRWHFNNQNGMLSCLLSTGSANIRSVLHHLSQQPTEGYTYVSWFGTTAHGTGLYTTCWFWALKSNLCFCQMFVCPNIAGKEPRWSDAGQYKNNNNVWMEMISVPSCAAMQIRTIPSDHSCMPVLKRPSSLPIIIMCCSCLLCPEWAFCHPSSATGKYDSTLVKCLLLETTTVNIYISIVQSTCIKSLAQWYSSMQFLINDSCFHPSPAWVWWHTETAGKTNCISSLCYRLCTRGVWLRLVKTKFRCDYCCSSSSSWSTS